MDRGDETRDTDAGGIDVDDPSRGAPRSEGPQGAANEPDTGQPADEGAGDGQQRPASFDVPPDPAAYDDPRAELARARGLSAPYIPGGRDPEPDAGIREERVYGRLLLLMVLAIVGTAFVLTIVAIALGAFGYSGR
jgi:hypothetical protein